MKIARNLVIAVIVILAVFLVVETFGTASLRRRAALIRVGDSHERVRSLLGRPSESSSISGGSAMGLMLHGGAPEWWAYGSVLNSLPFTREFPWIAPIKLHLFTPDTNEVAIYFDSSGRVVRVEIPST